MSPIGWEPANCVLIGDLPGLPGRRLFVNKRVVLPLRNALEQGQRTCPDYATKTMGCFNRPKRTNKLKASVIGWDQGLSLHTIAAAIDINAHWTPMQIPLKSDMPPAFVKAWP